LEAWFAFDRAYGQVHWQVSFYVDSTMSKQ